MDTELYCLTPDALELKQAIRAIQLAYLQLKALTNNVDCSPYDNGLALRELRLCLRQAGHIGFAP
jgi:hypothetical protein